ncbi:MAG: sensor histidine kinase [Anaerolineales bacterium]
MKTLCLVLSQSREKSQYNDLVGRSYHFPQKYLGQFKNFPVEFVYYEPTKIGDGVYFGYGKITSPPIKDKRDDELFFVEISDYKPFSMPVPVKDQAGKVREAESPHYNPQNAVRAISKELLDEICLDGKIRLNFKADAHLIKVLGEQLIASEKVGILELIKNAYDAGASYCKVRIENIPFLTKAFESEYVFPELPGPVIIIEDDGSGMTRDVIENSWLRPASTFKTVVKENIKKEREKAARQDKLGSFDKLISEIKKERGGRIPLGEKGVGRFASSRLGHRLLLKTKVKELDYEYLLDLDWDKFEISENSVKNLDDIGVTLSRQKPSRDYGDKGSGTQLIIYGGREGFSWDEETLPELHRSIASLNSPNPSPKKIKSQQGFGAYLECPQIGDLSTDNLYFPPTFSFNGLVDENGLMEYSLKFQPPGDVPMSEDEIRETSYDLRKAKTDYWLKPGDKNLRKPECGQFYIHIDIWYRRAPWIPISGPDGKNFIDQLTKFGGISIFRDGITIFSAEWGAETDWLSLSKEHIKKGKSISYYNMIGNLEIDQTENIGLTDKTDREGLIANQAFKDLTQLVRAIVKGVIETNFMGKRDQYTNLIEKAVRDPKVLKEFAKQGEVLIHEIAEKYPLEDDPYQLLDQFGNRDERSEKLVNLSSSLKNLQKSIELIEEAQDLLTEHAGYGMAVAVSVHEIAKIAANFYEGVSYLLKSKTPDMEKLQNLRDASESLQSELKRLSPLRAVKNESSIEFEITKPINYVIEVFHSRIEKAGIKVVVNVKESFRVYGRYGALCQIFSNFFDNSCYWLSMIPEEQRKIQIQINAKNRIVIVADSGPGIDAVILPYLFQAGYSLRIPPSGLGLYICRYYMHSMNGDVYITTDRERLSNMAGAQFTLDFNKVLAERPIGEKK